jgi:ferritin-like metal-binding protein YciE
VARSAQDLRALLVRDLQEMFGADRLLLAAWPRLVRASTARPLRKFCREGVDYTKERLTRLQAVLRELGERPRAAGAPAMRRLIADARLAARNRRPALRDVAILGAMQRISHHGRAGYGSMWAYAAALGERRAAALLKQCYREKDDATKEMVTMFAKVLLPRAKAARI